MYSIYQLTKDFHLSKNWCKSQGSSSVIYGEQSSTLASFSPSTRSILIYHQGLAQKAHFWQYQRTQSHPTTNIIQLLMKIYNLTPE